MNKKLQLINDTIVVIKNFPTNGISFKDLTPILADKKVFKLTIDEMANLVKDKKFDYIVALESRGFWFGLPLAYKLNIPFIPIRKKGKLPRKTMKVDYALEYGIDTLEIHKDDIKPGKKVLLIDDIIATGGTIIAAKKMLNKMKVKCDDVLVLGVLKDLPQGTQRVRKVGLSVHHLLDF